MTSSELPSTATSQRPAIATGWVLWLSWAFVLIFGFMVFAELLIGAVGAAKLSHALGMSVTRPHMTLWWVLTNAVYVFFGIGCLGVLLRDRGMARSAVWLAWAIVALQCGDAVLQLSHATLEFPISALLYGAYAIGLSKSLRGAAVPPPPGSGGML